MDAITSKISTLGAGSNQPNEHCSCCLCRQRADQLLNISQASLLTLPGPSRISERTGPSFLDLPIELRHMVYEELLVVGKVFFANETAECRNNGRYNDANQYAHPALSILRVCKLVHAEAEPIYVSKNLFVLPLRWHHMEPFHSKVYTDTYDPKATHLMSRNAARYLKNVSIALDQSDLTAYTKMNHDYWNDRKEEFARINNYTMSHQMHDDMMVELENARPEYCTGFIWAHISTSLDKLFEGLDGHHLDYIEIDYSNAFCPFGCCRPLELFDLGWIVTLKPTRLEIIGCWEDDEEAILEDITWYSTDTWVEPPIVFFEPAEIVRFRHSDDLDPWAQWMLSQDPHHAGENSMASKL